MSQAAHILHIIPRGDWGEGVGDLEPASLAAEGFVHCSDPDQVLHPADTMFTGREDLLLLVVEVARLTAPLVYEDCYASGMAFPHVYGPLDASAVVAAFAFPPCADGTFSMPADLTEWLEAR